MFNLFKHLRSKQQQQEIEATNPKDQILFWDLNDVGHGLIYQEHLNRKLTAACVYLSVTLCIMLLTLSYFAFARPEPVYFGVNQAMQILPMYPLHEPMHTDQALKSWAAQATIDIFNLDFVHYREQLANSRQYFTKQAFLSFHKSLHDEGHLKILAQYRALMHGVCTGPPIIVAQGVLENCMTWELEVPFQLAYETSEKILSNQHFIVRLRVKRVSTAEYVQGLAITQMIVVKTSKFAVKS
ncbi:MAG: DotI/IcmL/TraM family protein [Desulfovibrionaceae bacterium]|nr:DotI/IcmL/TraM family protein [Desulfovibrionaceae bacterium]